MCSSLVARHHTTRWHAKLMEVSKPNDIYEKHKHMDFWNLFLRFNFRQMLCSSTEEVTPGSSYEPVPSSSTFTPYSSIKYGQIMCRQQEDPRSSSVLHTSFGSDDVGTSLCPGSTAATDTGAAQTAGFTETPPAEGERGTTHEIKD